MCDSAEDVQVEKALTAWRRPIAGLQRLGGGNRSRVWSVELGGKRYAARLSARSTASVLWELDLLDYLARLGMRVPRAVPDANGSRIVNGVIVFTWLEGEPPTTADDWRRVAAALRLIHEATRGWPQRPGFRSTQQLLTESAGGDVLLDAMPAEAVTICRSAWRVLAGQEQSVVHGDPNAHNIRIRHGAVGLIDWDEACIDVSLLDFADLPVEVPELAQPDRRLAVRRAADAWEAACSWLTEPDYARRRLHRLAAR